MSVVLHIVPDMNSTSQPEELLPSRAAKEAVSEIMGMSVFGLFIVFALGAFPAGSDGGYRAVELASRAGIVLLQHIGWAFGAYIPILLGFYAIVIGGQLVADPAVAARTRRTLGFVAEAMAGALVPALVLILVACIAEPSHVGALFVVVPVSALMFFLAVQLGGFIVFERALRLESAERSRNWARQRLHALRHRSPKAIWLIFVVHTVLGGAIGAGTTMLLTRPAGSLAVLFVLYGMIALGLAFAGVHGVYMFHTARDRASKVVAWLIASSLYFAALFLDAEIFLKSGLAAGYSVLAIIALSLVLTFWPRNHAPRFLVNWSIQGGAAGLAAKSVVRTYASSVREIRELRARPVAAERMAFRERMVVALQAFRDAIPARVGATPFERCG